MAFTPKSWVNGTGANSLVDGPNLIDLETRVSGYTDTHSAVTTGVHGIGYGTVASAATVTLPNVGVVTITGTTTITSITAGTAGRRVTLIFAGALTLVDGSNLKLAGNLVTVADDAITLVSNGTNWYEA